MWGLKYFRPHIAQDEIKEVTGFCPLNVRIKKHATPGALERRVVSYTSSHSFPPTSNGTVNPLCTEKVWFIDENTGK